MTKVWPCHGSRGRSPDSHRKDPVRYQISPRERWGKQSDTGQIFLQAHRFYAFSFSRFIPFIYVSFEGQADHELLAAAYPESVSTPSIYFILINDNTVELRQVSER
jgi:hypothetical protein